VVGLVAGGAIAYALLARRAVVLREAAASAIGERAGLQARLDDLTAQLQREREFHEAGLASLNDRFAAVANETLAAVVQGFNANQLQAMEQRELRLDERLTPLKDLLDEYKDKVEELERNRERGYGDVKNATEKLLEAQTNLQSETQRLNTILGRSGDRGRWGEVQLERILELSGMKEHIDFSTQVTMKSSTEKDQRPDVVVRLPNDANIAIDSKVPLDAFERSLDAATDDERDALMKEHAAKLRGHVAALAKRDYASALDHSPSFVVCFVPSDQLLSAAFSADPTLLTDSISSRVLIAGPTTLLGLMWSVWMGWSQFKTAVNIEEIRELASSIADRTAVLYGHLNKLGKNINGSVDDFNKVVGSMERNLLTSVRAMKDHGISSTKSIATVGELTQHTRQLDERRWPHAKDYEPLAIDAEIIELGDDPQDLDPDIFGEA